MGAGVSGSSGFSVGTGSRIGGITTGGVTGDVGVPGSTGCSVSVPGPGSVSVAKADWVPKNPRMASIKTTSAA